MDRSAALRPLAEANGPIRDLEEYRSERELNAAIHAVGAAVERSLRLALRTDTDAPEEQRLAAMSAEVVPLDQVIQSLRARDRIRLETAGAAHQLIGAVERAATGRGRPSDADVAVVAVDKLRADLSSGSSEPAAPAEPKPGAPTGRTPDKGEPEAATGADPDAGSPGPPSVPVAPPPKISGGGRWMAWIGVAMAVTFMIGLAWVLGAGGEDHYRTGVAMFRAGRLDSAAVAFERALQERPVDVDAMLYLGRIHRRQDRLVEASEVLREAVRVAPDDAVALRELGHLFMDAGQPERAVEQYQRALEQDPDAPAGWAGLYRALRAMSDPRAEQLLDRAPDHVREALGVPPAEGT